MCEETYRHKIYCFQNLIDLINEILYYHKKDTRYILLSSVIFRKNLIFPFKNMSNFDDKLSNFNKI